MMGIFYHHLTAPLSIMGRKLKSVSDQAQDLLAARTTSRGRPKLWKNYTAAEKRVAVAFDVIQGAFAGLYEPMSGHGYLPLEDIKHAGRKTGEQSLQKLLTGGHLQECIVCALGACFLSVVRFENQVNFTDLTGRYSTQATTGSGQPEDPFRLKLKALFSTQQLSLIEIAFEFGGPFSAFGEKPKGWRKASNFGERHEDDTDRLLAICINIIKNDGTFKP